MVVGCVELPAFLNLGYISPERSLKIYSSAFLLFHVYVFFFKLEIKIPKQKWISVMLILQDYLILSF